MLNDLVQQVCDIKLSTNYKLLFGMVIRHTWESDAIRSHN
jgi:hypothetical protein